MVIDILTQEHWWGGLTDLGAEMPFGKESNITIKMRPIDQGACLFVSDKGRYIYSPNKHDVVFAEGKITLEGNCEDVIVKDGFGTLKGAHLALVQEFFKLNSNIPDTSFFRTPQFNTWMALGYQQTEEGILEYASAILENGFEPGVFMIDEGWSEDYGVYDFYPGRFRDPKGMIEKLHRMGFKVMLWVTPNISPDSAAYREIEPLGYLIRNREGNPAIRKWWNGYSCVLDLTNPEAFAWYIENLKACMKNYGADGFKFDAGDWYFYRDDDITYEKKTDNEMTAIYNKLGRIFGFHEFRTAWNVRGTSVFCRMQDKLHTWEKNGIASIIPNSIVQGLIGCLYCCPDMVGGGAIESAGDDNSYDTELYLRWTEANAYCAMMQFSIAPWKVLSKEECEIVKKYAGLHLSVSDEIIALAENASKTGEPILRAMEYQFPGQGMETVTDQFMLGANVLVAPVTQKGATSRKVIFPKGQWQNEKGEIIEGGQTVAVSAKLEELPVFRMIR